MQENIRIAIAQMNATVGDLEGNATKIIRYIRKAGEMKANLVVFPEAAITGYPAEDLWLKPGFIEGNKRKLEEIALETKGIAAIVGFVDRKGGCTYNSAAFVSDGKIKGVQNKIHLPNYGVFDEKRYFVPGKESKIFELNGVRFGINVCEDIWAENGPVGMQAEMGAEFIVNISASPFHAGKSRVRRELVAKRARESGIPVIYCNLVGGQDGLVFDGGSCAFDSKGRLIKEAGHFREDLVVTGLEGRPVKYRDDEIGEIYSALVLGTRDYVRKNGFGKVILGLSGGIDSSLTAAISADALGKENVIGLLMPSSISSGGSIRDARKLAENLGIGHKEISIGALVDAYGNALRGEFRGTKTGTAEENIQARIRGNILMALSNKSGYLVLTTGNKSELAVGYCTLYGDMSGGLAVIADVPKTTVYKLAEYVNKARGRGVIPRSVLLKEPSAELRKGQRDSDSLPPYGVLDPILKLYVEENKTKGEIISRGFGKKTVEDIIRRVDHNEYKRRQAAPCIKITPKAFGRDRRMPITNSYDG